MKAGDPIHVGTNHIVTLCHAIAYIPSRLGVLWHTEEDGYVLLGEDINGHLTVQLVIDDVAFMRDHKDEARILQKRRKNSKGVPIWKNGEFVGYTKKGLIQAVLDGDFD